MAQPYILVVDQGTTSTRAVVFDSTGRVCGSATREIAQIYPQPAWVEHDPEEIWNSVQTTIPVALVTAGIGANEIAGMGLSNQRETVVIWERATGKAIANAIVWQDR